ncbi:hypothetical protein SAMN05446037_100286 [Anaerovirgula multivorans]|uniref:Uncharacterized protein n=1 Tax=Anaerovirgula multivorans TaxID=312168 RepID=A0A239ALG7_9FIRM|nr:hypothetical protein [Anaerovirgula multivorans]SNR95773.1 hypothetical protein SAMN05446037_100286 [Anaerovirgula multivorans]
MNEYAEILKYKSTDKGTMLVVVVPDKDIGDYLKRFAKDGLLLHGKRRRTF